MSCLITAPAHSLLGGVFSLDSARYLSHRCFVRDVHSRLICRGLQLQAQHCNSSNSMSVRISASYSTFMEPGECLYVPQASLRYSRRVCNAVLRPSARQTVGCCLTSPHLEQAPQRTGFSGAMRSLAFSCTSLVCQVKE
jgi:hypothetical protein